MLCWVVGAAKFSDSNVWTASTKVTPKGLLWLPCTYWRLGWCRMPQSPVLIQWCENCLVVVGLCLMLCHTQCIRNLDWNEQWFSRAPVVCLCPLGIGLDLGRLCAESLTNWRVSWKRGAIAPQPQGFRWFLNRRKFTFMGYKPETHPCCPFLYGIYCLL